MIFQKLLILLISFSSLSTHAQTLGPTYIRHDARMHIRAARPQGYGPAPVSQAYAVVAPTQTFDPAPVRSSNIAVWCGDVVRDLNRNIDLAEIQQRMGHFDVAKQILVQGLVNTHANQYLRKGPLTAKAIFRALELAKIMEQSMTGRVNAPRSEVLFIVQYYQFIINTANNLDLPFNFRRDSYCRCDQDYFQEMERNFTQFAKDEVQLVLDFLTVSDGVQIYPVGSTQAFVNILNRSIHYASQDFQESSYAANYSCTVTYLNQLSTLLNQGEIGNEPDTVRYAYNEVSALLDEVQPGCNYYR